MGCCGSKESQDEDDVHAPLLYKRPTFSDPVAPIDTKKEQEFWDQVVYRATQSLIDVSSAPNEPLQHQDIEARAQRYREVVNQVIMAQHPVSSSLLLSSSIPTEEPIPPPSWLDQAMLDLHHALTQFKVEPKGALVIPLATR
ncbi:hypothetical protein [Absidia glauca]|uniref:Late endosomal/lysosomal adaptor and MAPK and MTOR activator 1 n=1 Tax=Absidia glauca TaxID=4829 RepID=A0A163JGL9_ABSGL|nr:hypothetical protein [Absidia glauca]